MPTSEELDRLQPQHRIDRWVHVLRLILVAGLSALLLARGGGASPELAAGFLVVAWTYAGVVLVVVPGMVSLGPLRWLTSLADPLLISLATTLLGSLTVGFALLVLWLSFSALQGRPAHSLATALVSTVLYLALLLYFSPEIGANGAWPDQFFLLGTLVFAGAISVGYGRSAQGALRVANASREHHRQTEARLETLSIHLPGVLFQAELGDGFRFTYVSQRSQELLRLDPSVLTQDPDAFFRNTEGGLAARLRDQLAEQAEDRSNFVWEFSFGGQSIPQRWLQVNVTSQRTPAGTFLVHGLVTDVTSQRETAEALRASNQAKTDFLATMSHELRTPLNAILGNVEHLSRLADQDDDKKAFQAVLSSGEALLGLIEDILVFSRVEAGRLSAEIRPFVWKPQIEAVLDAFRSQASAKEISLNLVVAGDPPLRIWSDALRVRQIVGNLVSNAVKFTPSGSVTVFVDLSNSPQTGWFRVTVVDTGIGIPANQTERIFEKFTQGDHGMSRNYGGLGLGLSISRSLAAILGGSLEVTSELGVGSQFRLQIPVRIADPLPPETPTGTELATPLGSTRVLLVEDNLPNQDVATRMLKKLGVVVDVASSGRAAIEAVGCVYYDLIFMDWQMPIMDGKEAAARIRKLPGGRDLVIVALSGHALPGDRELLLASGFDDYLAKPVRMEDFRVTLSKWVSAPKLR